MTLSYLSPGVHIRYNRYSAKIIIQEIPISLCVCKLNLHLGCCITHATVSAVLLQEQGCRKKCPAGSDSYTAISCPSYTTFTSSIREISTFAPCLGEQVTQSILSGNGCVPLVSIQTYFPIRCRRSTNSLSIQSEGSPPVSITVLAGYFPTSAKISLSDINTPSSCCVSQKEHFRLQPEKRTKTAGVPV